MASGAHGAPSDSDDADGASVVDAVVDAALGTVRTMIQRRRSSNSTLLSAAGGAAEASDLATRGRGDSIASGVSHQSSPPLGGAPPSEATPGGTHAGVSHDVPASPAVRPRGPAPQPAATASPAVAGKAKGKGKGKGKARRMSIMAVRADLKCAASEELLKVRKAEAEAALAEERRARRHMEELARRRAAAVEVAKAAAAEAVRLRRVRREHKKQRDRERKLQASQAEAQQRMQVRGCSRVVFVARRCA